MMKVPRVESKLRVFSFKLQFSTQACVEVRFFLILFHSIYGEIYATLLYVQVKDLRRNLSIVNNASKEVNFEISVKNMKMLHIRVLILNAFHQVRESMKFRQIMQTILSLGNALNQGTARGIYLSIELKIMSL
jgi:hypothetical protein